MSDMSVVAAPGQTDIVMTRTFDAPRDLLFTVYTDAKHIPNWWGPKYLTTTVDVLDARTGGAWRFVQRDLGGQEHSFRGVYHEVAPSERIVSTFEYEQVPGSVALETAVLEDVGNGRTKLTTRTAFASVADRDAAASTGMEDGMRESMDRLAELLAVAKATR